MLNVYDLHDGMLRRLVCSPDDPAMAHATWIDLLEPTRAEEQAVEARLGIDIPSREEMRSVEASSAAYHIAGATVMTARVLSRHADAELKLVDVKFILRRGVLATLRYGDPQPFRTFVDRAEREADKLASGEAVLVGLLEAVIDRAAEIQGAIGDELETLSTDIFSRNADAPAGRQDFNPILRRIGRNGDLGARIRQSLHTIGRVVPFLANDRGVTLDDDLRTRLATLGRDLASLLDHGGHLESQVTFLLDATLGLISIQQNAIVKILSVASVVFLPPTLIASLYGMNFKNIPELQWDYGYPYALALMVATAVLPYLWFKRRGWL